MSKQPKKTDLQLLLQKAEYPPEAFEFVQQGLAFTVEHVHGEMGELEKQLHQQMAEQNIDYDTLCEAFGSGLLDDELTNLVDQLGGLEKINRHVSGEQLCLGLRELALQKWGMMAPSVLRKWGIQTTSDFGKIVFFLVENSYLQKQPHDTVEDFDAVYDFRTAFQPKLTL